jgi:hypothetical protein
MALRSTRPLTEINTRNLPGCEGRPALKAENLYEPIFYKKWEPRRFKTLWALTSCFLFSPSNLRGSASNEATSAPCHIFSDSLFTDQFIIEHYVVWVTESAIK